MYKTIVISCLSCAPLAELKQKLLGNGHDYDEDNGDDGGIYVDDCGGGGGDDDDDAAAERIGIGENGSGTLHGIE